MAGLYSGSGKGRRGGKEDTKGSPASICFKLICATYVLTFMGLF